MATIGHSNPPVFEGDPYQLETTDPVQGGAGGIANEQARMLGENDNYLKKFIEALQSGVPGVINKAFNTAAIGRGALSAILSTGPQRNTVLSGALDTAGLENYLNVTTSSTPQITLDYSATPLVLSFADGWDANGSKDIFKILSGSTMTIGGAGTIGVVQYIYINYNTTFGTYSLNRGALGPIYSRLAPPSPANFQPWFDLNRMRLYVWDTGTNAWVLTYSVYIAEYTRTGTTTGTVSVYPMRTDYGMGLVAVGTVSNFLYTGGAPYGWLLCDGSTYDKRLYPELFNQIGYFFGGSSNSFNVPTIPAISVGAGINYYIRAK